mmetsp:Transcript_72079/g.206917  ORF Transcript_72079/g.206917 Transcript_72079/m.206917 type:complete len:271 (+) Transcript_72079:229-1041(+)
MIRSVGVFGALAASERSLHSSFNTSRSIPSASALGRAGLALAPALALAAGPAGCLPAASWTLSKMCRSLKVFNPTLAFFAGGMEGFFSSPAWLPSLGGRKQACATTICGGTWAPLRACSSRTRAEISLTAKRGCMRKSAAIPTNSDGSSTVRTVDEPNIRKGCLAKPFNAVPTTSGVQPGAPGPPRLRAGPPRQPEAAACPPALTSAGLGRSPSESTSASVAMQRPRLAKKTWSPTTSATAAPQPSWISAVVARKSASRSWKLLMRAAFT